MKELKINPVFRDLIQPLTAEEFKQLEDNVLADGIRDAIVVWNDTIIDGHNRYQLAQEHGLNFNVYEKQYESEDHAVLWIIDNQMGRRNLSDFVRLELQQKRADVLYEQGRQVKSETAQAQTNRGNRYKKVEDLSPSDKSSKTEPAHNTRDEIAKALNWSTGKVAMGNYLIDHAPEEVKEQLRANDISIKKAYYDCKKQVQEQKKQNAYETQDIPEADKILIEKLKKGCGIVLNINTNIHAMQYAKSINKFVLIDRTTDWGNPYILDKDGDREFICESHKIYFNRKISLQNEIHKLKGMALGCHCYPKPCHGNYLKILANGDDN